MMNKYRQKAMTYLRNIYGKRFQAFPADQVEMTEYFFWLNDTHGVKLH